MPHMRFIFPLLTIFFVFSHLANAQPFQNSSFEDIEDSIPENWSVSPLGAGVSQEFATDGQYALSVWNWYYYGKGAAVLGQGEPPFQMQHAGLPFQGAPNYLTGTYAFIEGDTYSNNDSAVVGIALKKFNTFSNMSDTIAFGEIRLPPSTFATNFELPIRYRSFDTCDTIVVWVLSSDSGFCGVNSNGDCLHLYVDNLMLQSGSSTAIQPIDHWFGATTILQPNPAKDFVRLATSKTPIHLEVYTITGKLALSTSQNLTQAIDISSLPRGVYVARIGFENGTTEQLKLIVD